MTTTAPYERAVTAIDVENSGDPDRVTVDGVDLPFSTATGRIAVDWATRFAIFPSEPLLLAARAHQLGHWRVPRGEYPTGPAGEDRWVRDRNRVQTRRLTRLLGSSGYADRAIDRVMELIDEQRRPADTEARHLVDAVSIAGLQARTPVEAPGSDTTAWQMATQVIGRLSPAVVEELVDAEPMSGNLLQQALAAAQRTTRPRDLTARADRVIARTLAVANRPVVTTSMQLGGLVLIDLIRKRLPSIPVVFVDTGYQFEETIAFRDRVVAEWGLNLVVAHPDRSREDHEAEFGPMWAVDPVRCCAIRKVAPADHALAGHDAWLTALRRDQSSTRAAISPVEPHRLATGHLITKVNPLAGWEWADLERYAIVNGVPRHPLYDEGYTSIGCAPCTKPTGGSGDDRSGRWNGTMVECGLHIDRSRVG